MQLNQLKNSFELVESPIANSNRSILQFWNRLLVDNVVELRQGSITCWKRDHYVVVRGLKLYLPRLRHKVKSWSKQFILHDSLWIVSWYIQRPASVAFDISRVLVSLLLVFWSWKFPCLGSRFFISSNNFKKPTSWIFRFSFLSESRILIVPYQRRPCNTIRSLSASKALQTRLWNSPPHFWCSFVKSCSHSPNRRLPTAWCMNGTLLPPRTIGILIYQILRICRIWNVQDK